MTRRLVSTYLVIAVFVLLVLEIPFALTIASREYDRLEADVVSDAVVLTALVEEDLEDGATVVLLPDAVLDYARDAQARIVVTDVDGISLADTDAQVPRDFSTRPEVAEALSGTRSTGRRRSESLDVELVYVAVPIASAGEVLGVVRITYPTAVVQMRIARQWLVLLAVAVVVLGAVAVVAARLARWTVQPVERIQDAVARFGDGDLAARAAVTRGPPEVVALAERVDDMAGRIAALVEVQRGFLADASHQLRTPLTGLRLELENLELAATDDATRTGLERAVEGTQRLGRMLDGLLALARLEGRRAPVVPVDAAALLAEAGQRWEALAAEQEVRLDVDARALLGVPAVGVADHLAQVLDVLIDNALSVSQPDGTVALLGRVEQDAAVLLVVDQGPGMSAADREDAFARRWQGADREGGTGLGLAIARRLAESARATVRLDAAASGGVEAVVTLGRG